MDDIHRKQANEADEALLEVPEDVLEESFDLAERGPDALSEGRLVAIGVALERLKARAKFAEAQARDIAKQAKTAEERLRRYYGDRLLEAAQALIPANAKPRYVYREGVKIGLRKLPGRIEEKDMSAFYAWDREHEELGLSRRTAGFKDLTVAELETVQELVGKLPEELLVKWWYHTEVRKDAVKQWIKGSGKGEIPAGLDFIEDEKVYFECEVSKLLDSGEPDGG